ncbi:MAG: glycoside hydrolase family 28 protein [Lactobacillus sp.]|jgi:polygalacturonase|nr:glycoside hydrolase family 28 protein [Lactobacillus sp.]
MNTTINVCDYQSIQAAIDANMEAQNLDLLVPKGTYLSGPLTLRSNLTMTFESGAVLKFEDDPNLYPPVWSRWEGVECYALQPLIYGKNVENVIIQGPGIIDGNGQGWWLKFKDIIDTQRNKPKEVYERRLAALNPDYATRTSGGGRPNTQFLRPPLVQFYQSRNVEVRDITLKNSPFWTLHLLYSQQLTVDNVTFSNPKDAFNTDAIDIDSSQDVRVKNCLIDVGDDGITLKSGAGQDGLRVDIPTQRVNIAHCKIMESHGGVAIGSETAAGIRDVHVEDCEFQGTQRGIRLKSRRTRGGTIEGIFLKNLKMDRCWCPIALQMYYTPGIRNSERAYVLSLAPQAVNAGTPHIQHIEINNIVATNVRAVAAFIVGLPESKITNVKINDYHWHLATKNQLLSTDHAEMTDGLFHDDDRGIKAINVSNFSINNQQITNK